MLYPAEFSQKSEKRQGYTPIHADLGDIVDAAVVPCPFRKDLLQPNIRFSYQGKGPEKIDDAARIRGAGILNSCSTLGKATTPGRSGIHFLASIQQFS